MHADLGVHGAAGSVRAIGAHPQLRCVRRHPQGARGGGVSQRISHPLLAGGTPFTLLVRVSIVSGVSSALLTNDSTCVILTQVRSVRGVLTGAMKPLRALCTSLQVIGASCHKRRLHPAPYLLALATCSNIGSACSPIGNPQNMIIALVSGVTFMQFLACIGVASVVGVAVNTAFIAWMYRSWIWGGRAYEWTAEQGTAVGGSEPVGGGGVSVPSGGGGGELLSDPSGVARHTDAVDVLVPGAVGGSAPTGEGSGGEFDTWGPVAATPSASGNTTTSTHAATPAAAVDSTRASAPSAASVQADDQLPAWRRKGMLAVLAATPVALLVADRWIGLGWMTLLAGSVLIVLDGRPPDTQLARVDGMLLLFFSGLFIVVAGFNATGVPESAWASIASAVSMDTATGLFLYTVIILVGSNTVSNVPLVLLLAPKLLQATGQTALVYWTELAWISTVAGNLTLLGSVANLIVAERCKGFYPLRFMEYLWVGAPTTVALCIAGVPVVRAIAMMLPA